MLAPLTCAFVGIEFEGFDCHAVQMANLLKYIPKGMSKVQTLVYEAPKRGKWHSREPGEGREGSGESNCRLLLLTF